MPCMVEQRIPVVGIHLGDTIKRPGSLESRPQMVMVKEVKPSFSGLHSPWGTWPGENKSTHFAFMG